MFLRTAKILLLLLVFSLCYIQPFVLIFNFQIPPTEFIFLGTAAFWLLALITRQTRFRFHNFFWLLLFYFAAMLISAIFSDDRRLSFIKLAGEIYLLSLPVLIYNLIENQDELKRAIQIWLYATAFAVLLGVLVFALFYLDREHRLLTYTIGGFGAVPVGNYPRLRLNSLSPSLLCNYLSVGFALLLIAAKSDWIGKKLALIFAALIFIIAVFTISSGLGGFALILGLWIFYLYRNRSEPSASAGGLPLASNPPADADGSDRLVAVLSLSGGILTAILFWILNFVALQPHSTAPYAFNFFGYEFYPSPRLLIWQESLQTFLNNFFFGRGVGQDSCNILFQNTDGSFATLTDAHNVFLSVASQEGIFGLAAIVTIIFYLVKKNTPAIRSTGQSSIIPAGLLIAFVSAFVYQGLVGSFEDARHLWVLIGLMLCAGDLAAHRSE